MRFTKMHGLGNDYLYVYGDVPENIEELAQKLSEEGVKETLPTITDSEQLYRFLIK